MAAKYPAGRQEYVNCQNPVQHVLAYNSFLKQFDWGDAQCFLPDVFRFGIYPPATGPPKSAIWARTEGNSTGLPSKKTGFITVQSA